jgi:hypothetical protein
MPHQLWLAQASEARYRRAMRGRVAGVVVTVVLATAGGASATESTIYPGVGIGKVKLGMTQAQVKHVLGSGAIVNGRETISGAPYVELGWNFSEWSVGFVRRGSTYRAVHVTTEQRAQRTTTGIGPGTFWLKLVKAYPGGVCTFNFTGRSGALEYLVPHKGGTQTIFLLHAWPPRSGSYGVSQKTYFVISVAVRTLYQARPEFARDYPYRCKSGYQSTPLPRSR